ncbi:MAG: hypothetical protein H0V66_09690 [Bdellovibrionales bacterium]|nr:hypothetical protein [Bdellovibrionales bacterium]
MLFFRPRPETRIKPIRPTSSEKLFAQVILAAQPQIEKLWEEGDRLIKKEGLKCESEIQFQTNIGRSFYQCQPHFWQCYWSGGVKKNPGIEIEMFGQTFHIKAKPSFQPISAYSSEQRFYEILKGPYQGMNFHYGVLVELTVDEVPDMTWPMILTDTCRDVYLPERIYGYGKIDPKKNDQGFLWDNFERQIFIDKFYVSNQQANEWRILSGTTDKIISDRAKWPHPALLTSGEQKSYCSFWGKKVFEAKLFDAATMTPADLTNPLPERVPRPQTPWQRDIGKSFLGMSRINGDYQLTPLDCQLAQVQGCSEKYFSTDSVTWMGLNFALGFYPEALVNPIEPEKNLKLSSKFQPPASEVHELGIRGQWNGSAELPVAFRCYEEVSL